MLRYTVTTSGQVQPSLYAGPYVAFAVNQGTSTEIFDVNADEAFKDTDFGITVGGNVGFGLSGQELTVGARYDLGLTNVADDEDVGIKTGTIAVLLGVTF